ncbi:hypothetical protein QBC35DRAFT_542352 [Podospora australis]|uniref:Uncharacterized protein n=1 Tax=Podospora australis TaxID=1536484 RepID=A0AAN7AEK7_9PEZI|nr:hypothetical protein QBC35DRAFT_542352 [Podospora australis]
MSAAKVHGVNERTPLLSESASSSTDTADSDVSSNTNDNVTSDSSLSDGTGDHDDAIDKNKKLSSWTKLRKAFALGVEHQILLTAFLITLSFSFTQVPILYVFHLMECDAYYADPRHPPYNGPPGGRCDRNEIAAGMAQQFSILGMSTTFFGTINLFVSGWTAKRIGPKRALMVQTFVPGIRVATQILGVMAGGKKGMLIIQLTQIITIIGGPAGYLLIMNIIAGEAVAPLRRTAVFGMLQGCIMLGQGLGYLTGGMIGDNFGIRRPFEVAFCSFMLVTCFVAFTVPHIDADTLNNGEKKPKGISQFFTPLRILIPQRVLSPNGTAKKHYGVTILCAGIFLAVLATGFAPLLIQLYATAKFQFTQADNGLLTSEFAFMRGAFLIFVFPKIISRGRKWHMARQKTENVPSGSFEAEETQSLLESSVATDPQQFDAPIGNLAEEEPVEPELAKEDEGTEFDLHFLRISLLVDGFLTLYVAFATKSWHIYLGAFLLPLASGSAPAAKGVMTEMCPPSRRADALSALGLVENVARLSTQGLFGFVFSALADAGKPHLTFFVNAAIAVVAYLVLLLSRFPPEGTKVLDDDDLDVNDP